MTYLQAFPWPRTNHRWSTYPFPEELGLTAPKCLQSVLDWKPQWENVLSWGEQFSQKHDSQSTHRNNEEGLSINARDLPWSFRYWLCLTSPCSRLLTVHFIFGELRSLTWVLQRSAKDQQYQADPQTKSREPLIFLFKKLTWIETTSSLRFG